MPFTTGTQPCTVPKFYAPLVVGVTLLTRVASIAVAPTSASKDIRASP
ncbi:hypothetical protein L195_g014616 [Trifolium pratense]|uniref:Uncharacterized protein n=1 Tax=Trifolium pratense TaxID=57577 RepID=A0A2K3PRE8_TRIPR|nr:hypothetical protein L195_g014616 [Trifolium pratense]